MLDDGTVGFDTRAGGSICNWWSRGDMSRKYVREYGERKCRQHVESGNAQYPSVKYGKV